MPAEVLVRAAGTLPAGGVETLPVGVQAGATLPGAASSLGGAVGNLQAVASSQAGAKARVEARAGVRRRQSTVRNRRVKGRVNGP
jgi:hypothetical protein